MPKVFRLTAPAPSEDELHAAVRDALDTFLAPPAFWTTMPAGGYLLSAAARARLYRLGLKTGLPDVLLWHARRSYGIELKDRDGRLSRTRVVRSKRTGRVRIVVGQQERHAELRAAGMEVAVCRSVDDVLRAVADWRLPVRARIAA
jgi:hypothetical protein